MDSFQREDAVREPKMSNELNSHALSRRVRSRDDRLPQVTSTRGSLIRGPVAGPTAAPPEVELLSPKRLLRGLLQHLMTALVLGIVVGASGAAAAWFLVQAPYEAKALIQVKSDAQKLVFNTADNAKHDHNYVRTQLQLITSDIVVRKALSRPGIADVDLFKSVENPRLYLRKHLRASTARSPELIELTLTGEDPRGLALVLKEVHEAYMEEIVAVERSHRAARLSELTRILQNQAETIRSQRNIMNGMASVVGTSTDSDVLELHQKTALESVSQMRSKWFEKKIELLREQALLAGMEETSKGQKSEIHKSIIDAHIAHDPDIQALEEQVGQKESLLDRTELLVKKKDHPQLVELRSQVASLNRAIAEKKSRLRPVIEQKLQADLLARSEFTVQDRRTRVQSLKNEEAKLHEEYEVLHKEALALTKGSDELDDKRELIEALEVKHDKIQDEISSLEVELHAPPRVIVLQEAEVPFQRDTKRRIMASAGAGIGGFALVCCLIAFAEARLRRIMTVDDVAGDLRVMGQVPLIPAWASRSSRAAKTKKGRFWHDMLTESIDAARTMMVHDAEIEDARLIMVVSAMPSEGKTTLSCHLASSLARAGRKVVLVDCDLRRPNVHRVFNVPNQAGFCEVVLGKVELDDAIQPGVSNGPAILSAGHLTATVSPLLGMDVTEQVFRSLRERFEFVIVDTSPVMIVHDTLVVAQHLDAAIVAVRKQVSRQAKVKAVVDRLQSLEVPVLGTVAIGLDSESQDFGSGYYQGYSKYYTSKRHA